MPTISNELLNDIRSKFAQIDSCPVQGQRVFFENAGGALTLNRVVDVSRDYAAIPDNQGRDNMAHTNWCGLFRRQRMICAYS